VVSDNYYTLHPPLHLFTQMSEDVSQCLHITHNIYWGCLTFVIYCMHH